MKIGNDWEIEADNMNVTLKRRVLVKATDKSPEHYTWRVEGCYSHIRYALKALVDLGVSDTHLKDLKTIVKKQAELYKLIEEVLNHGSSLAAR